ncbi:MAG: GNAT family N-acetyltransferase [Chthonomonadales bacterium]
MKTPFLVGKIIYLRPLHRTDLGERYQSWLNDPDVSRYLETAHFPQTLTAMEAFYESIAASRDNLFLAIADRATDLHIGNIKLGPINWVHRSGTLGLLIGERDYWGRGCGTEATRLVVEHAFYNLNLHRVDLGVYAEHTAAVRMYEKVGFKVEGCLRKALFHEGQYKDHLLMAILKDEYVPVYRSSAASAEG